MRTIRVSGKLTRERSAAPPIDLLQDDGRMSTVKPDLERARAAYAEGSWLEAHDAFVRADEAEPLAPEDLELLR